MGVRLVIHYAHTLLSPWGTWLMQPAWLMGLIRFRNCQIQFPDVQTFAEFPASKFTAVDSLPSLVLKKDGPIVWLNLRQEPDVYVNGEPICARPANKIGE